MNYIDRSRIEADWTCHRRRYWNTEYQAPGANVRGIVAVGDATALLFGSAMHNALAGSMFGTTSDEELAQILCSSITNDLSYLPPPTLSEYLNLGLGLFWGFVGHIRPCLLDEYKVEAIEREVGFMLTPDTQFMAKPDLILKRKSDNTYWYPDYKTTGFKTKQWMDSWQYSLQVHSGCHAIEETLGIRVEGGIIIGLYKGYHDKEGRLRSPFTYAYQSYQTGTWTHEYMRSWILKPLDEYELGLRHWAQFHLGEDVVKEQFPVVKDIMFNRELLEDWKLEQEFRESLIQGFHAGVGLLPEIFPMNLKSCNPVIGPACPYIDACHNPTVKDDPVGSRLYVVRNPHHTPELEAYERGEI